MSVFDLKQNVNELASANMGSSKMDFHQIPATRGLNGALFPQGAISFRWEQSGQRWWMPSKSYFRLRCSLTKADGSPLTLSDNIAPQMGFASNLFQSAEFRINDKVVSRIGDYMPQIDALEHRLSKSKSWLDSLASSTNFFDKDFATRQSAVCSDGKKSRDVEYDTLTKQSLGFADAVTVTIVVDTGVATFSASRAGKILVGDIIVIAGAEYRVSALPGTDTNVLLGGAGRTIAVAGTADFTVKRPSNEARGVSDFEVIYKCPLSIFKIPHALPAGRYEIIFNPAPSSQYKLNVIESRGASKTPGAGKDYDFSVNDFYFYCLQMDASRVDNISYLLDLENTSAQTDNIDNTSLQQKQFTVNPTTFALTTVYTDGRYDSDTRVPTTQFHSYDDTIPLIPSPKVGYNELKLRRWYSQYASQSLPSPDSDPLFNAKTDYTTQRYIDSQINSDAVSDTGGVETIGDWHDRGAYHHQRFQKDGSDRSTRVVLNQEFQTGTDVQHMRVMLFNHYRSVARVEIEDSRVISVQVEDI